ncbi:Glucose-6-phosphate 1-dehydrogenase [Dissophora globulifera]|uniref:Glucose-6-phosphate 1-dehydrogenase n=1 Tax=Dissophora globulifera TaxID=979702 RepID=A0A9P6RX25_9FUNG|nr:Glucose-6-phosphate 1-dehydrogenase [Dissophora globulifera]
MSSTTPKKEHFTVVVLGASGDLAKKKTFPALFGLYKNKYLDPNTHIIGYARTKMDLHVYHDQVSKYIKIKSDEDKVHLESFLKLCTYQSGQYDKDSDFQELEHHLRDVEKQTRAKARLFYMALPPSVFIPVAKSLKKNNHPEGVTIRLIVEKPFGMDLESSRELGRELGALFTEEEIYRIDHYLGKEMVKNLMILRFANVIFGSVWNRHAIDNIQITFKEKIGTEGRGGYFDEFGIIRDVMQNHLLQILSLVAMEPPVSLSAENVRDEKVKVLRYIPPIQAEDILLGQYVASEDGKVPGYLDDKTVPKGSKTPTYAAATVFINNERWSGVPFVLKCGKALDQQKTEIRIQFKDVAGNLFQSLSRNEIVIRVQPGEAVYVKMMNKEPGLGMKTIISDLDLSYSKRFNDVAIPEAYESLILDALNDDHSNFVRDDELDAAWKIFTPILKKIDEGHHDPIPYAFGSRGPKGVSEFVAKYGYHRGKQEYVWPHSSEPGTGQEQSTMSSVSLLETILYDPADGLFLFDYHCDRMISSAKELAAFFASNQEEFLRELIPTRSEIFTKVDAAVKNAGKDRRQRLRLLLDFDGAITIQCSHLPSETKTFSDASIVLLLDSQSTPKDNMFLMHKTTEREVYNDARTRRGLGPITAPKGPDEPFDVILYNEFDEVMEGTIANIAIEVEDPETGKLEWITPPVSCGLLAGVMRRKLLEEGQLRERVITVDDLKQAVLGQ